MRLLRAILIGLSGLIAVGCGDGGVQSPDFTSELQGIVITPASADVPMGRTAQFTAMGTWTLPPGSDAETEQRPLGDVDWHVSNANATIDANGLATGVAIGAALITASAHGIESLPATLNVTAAVLDSVTITPDNPTISLGNEQVFQLMGNYSDGSTAPVAATSWTSSAPAVATVSPSSGTSTTASSVSEGTTTITAQLTQGTAPNQVTFQDTVVLTVGPFQSTLVSLVVTPDPASAPIGRPQQFVATGQCTTAPFSAVTEDCVPPNVVWSVGTPAVATINAQGVAIGQAVGTTTVTATSGTISDSATFNVTQAVVTDLIVSPATASVPAGGSQVFTATAVFSDGSTGPITVNWASSATAVATVAPTTDSAQTTATAVAIGSATITASTTNSLGEPVDGSADLEVTGVVLTDLIRVETAAGEPQGRTTPGRAVEFVAIGQFSDGTEAPIDDTNITWTSGNAAIATVDAQGFATGVAQGQTTITATRVDQPTDSASAPLTVTDAVCTTQLLASEGATVVENLSPLCIGCSVENEANIINADDEDFATVSTPVGLLGATAGVTAGPGATPPYTVPFPAGSNAGFVIGKPAGTLLVAEVLSQVFVSTLLDGVVQESTSGGVTPLRVDLLGMQLLGSGTDTALVSIATSLPYDEIRLSVNSGVASALSTVQVFQACGTVEPPPPAAALTAVSRVEPDTTSVSVGTTKGLVVYGAFDDGSEAPIPDADLDWTSSNTALATVDANGVVTGVAPGAVTITATLKSGVAPGVLVRSASTAVTVVANVCTVPLTAAGGATVTEGTTGICLLCTVTNTPNVIDETPTTFATMSVPLAVLGGTQVTVQSPTQLTPDGPAGFLIARPVGQLLLAEVLSQIQVSTLLNGVVQQSSGPTIPLRADLLGLDLLGASGDTALVSFQPTTPYNQLRLSFSSVLAAGLLESTLQTVNVMQACSTVTPPAAP